jgi:RNA polymerase sigma-70 factor (ECF subfamily)
MNNDEYLVSGCLKGDRQCQRELFQQYKNTVLKVVAKSLGPHFDKEDVFQQVFIRVYKSLKNFKGLSSLNTWIYRIATKVCIDQLRQKYRKRQLNLVDTPDAENNHFDISQKTPFQEQERKELVKKIFEALDKLRPEKRIVVTMFEMEGFSLEEISEILEIPNGTVKSRLFHGRKELATHLKNYVDLS